MDGHVLSVLPSSFIFEVLFADVVLVVVGHFRPMMASVEPFRDSMRLYVASPASHASIAAMNQERLPFVMTIFGNAPMW